MQQFNSWNPSIGSTCASLYASEYICVGAPYTSTTASVTSTVTTSSTSPTSVVPSPLEPETWTNCTTYHYVVSGDDCYDLEQTNGITAAEVSYVGCILWIVS